MFNADVLQVFIGSPSDVKERDLVREVLAEWNARKSSVNNLAFVPVGWETHVFPDLSAPGQDLIDDQLVRVSDACIALFWMKLGGSMGVGASGTVHEIDRFREADKRVMAYFCDRKVSRRDALNYADDIRAVDELQRRLRGYGITGEYVGRVDLKRKLHGALDAIAQSRGGGGTNARRASA